MATIKNIEKFRNELFENLRDTFTINERCGKTFYEPTVKNWGRINNLNEVLYIYESYDKKSGCIIVEVRDDGDIHFYKPDSENQCFHFHGWLDHNDYKTIMQYSMYIVKTICMYLPNA